MNYTANYHLTQWEKDDHILMDDFNDNNAKIDAALAAASASAYVVGSYMGNAPQTDRTDRLIELGFRPRFVAVTYLLPDNVIRPLFYLIAENAEDTPFPRTTANGFYVNNYYYTLNFEGIPFSYIAFQ